MKFKHIVAAYAVFTSLFTAFTAYNKLPGMALVGGGLTIIAVLIYLDERRDG